MKVPVILAALVILSIGVINNRLLSDQDTFDKDSETVLSQKDELNPSPLPTVSANPTVKPSTPQPTKTPQSSVSPTTGDLVYPGAIVVSSEGRLQLKTNDDPQVVTNWYKEKIRGIGLNVKSFVQTSSNGNIENKLAGAGNNRNIEVEITKSSDSNNVYINVTE